MKYVEKIVDWVLNSSADPARTSLTVRGVLVAAIGVAVKASATACLVGLACIALDQSLLGQVIDAVVNIVFWTLSIVGSIAFLAGFARKLWLTITGMLS